MLWFVLFAVCVATACGAAEDERFLTVEFDVTPGGQVHSFSKSLHTFTCTFTYAAQGGTNEKWHLSLGASDDSAVYSCSIWRPQGKSYLFFTQFKVETIGGTIEFADAFSKAIDGEKEVPLQQDEYIIRENSVSHNPGPFRAELSKLMVVARAHHEEL